MKYRFSKWHFPWWSVRHQVPSPTTVLASSAVTAGIAKAHSASSSRKTSRAIFDSDSFDILVDGGATASISNSITDFVSPPKASSVRVKGFNGVTSSTKVGTVSWYILDDSGHRRTLKIRNTYYVPACPMRLLSPQHYSQVIQDHRGTYSTNYGDQVLFVWNHGRFKATMPLSGTTNVGIICSAPGHQVFSAFVGMNESASPSCFSSTIITDDEADDLDSEDNEDDTLSDAASLEGDDEDSNAASIQDNVTPDAPSMAQDHREASPRSSTRPDVIPFDLNHNDSVTNLPSQDDATSDLDDPSELLRWHYRLGRIPFANIRLMAARGEIPKRLATCRVPKCQSCLWGRATKQPWYSKSQTKRKIRTVNTPGECVSVDQLESPVPGLVGQNKGFFYRKRYKVATIFVDHYSRMSFVYLQESTKGEETNIAKKAFETHAATFGITIQNYHYVNLLSVIENSFHMSPYLP
jgi:hypothetical protein